MDSKLIARLIELIEQDIHESQRMRKLAQLKAELNDWRLKQ